MSKTRSLLFTALAAGAVLACEDAGLGPNGSGGDFTISVGSGLNPTYSWSAGPAFEVSVFRANGVTPAWVVADPLNEAIQSPVTHGTVPGNATELVDNETTLESGVRYEVTVKLANGDEAFREFSR